MTLATEAKIRARQSMSSQAYWTPVHTFYITAKGEKGENKEKKKEKTNKKEEEKTA